MKHTYFWALDILIDEKQNKIVFGVLSIIIYLDLIAEKNIHERVAKKTVEVDTLID